MIQVGCKGHAALRVTTENTARAMGSGELPVLATPAVAALVEKTCWQAIAPELELGMTTVGTSLQLAHTAPTPIGMVVQCDCEVLEVTDRRVRFGFRVYDDVTEVAGGEHERYLVDAERFLKKAESKMNCTPFVRQYGILSNKWGVFLCQKEYQTNDIRRNSKNW